MATRLSTTLPTQLEAGALAGRGRRAAARAKTLLSLPGRGARCASAPSSFGDAGRALVTWTVRAAAATMSDPADLINRAIEALVEADIDLPAFSTLDRLVGHLRAEVHDAHLPSGRRPPRRLSIVPRSTPC